MSKQRADNGIDYTPRSEKAIKAAEAARRPKERHIHGVVLRQQHYPIFEVTAGGKTVEWTDVRGDAHKAFHDVSVFPKRLILVHQDGRRQLLDELLHNKTRQPEMRLAA